MMSGNCNLINIVEWGKFMEELVFYVFSCCISGREDNLIMLLEQPYGRLPYDSVLTCLLCVLCVDELWFFNVNICYRFNCLDSFA